MIGLLKSFAELAFGAPRSRRIRRQGRNLSAFTGSSRPRRPRRSARSRQRARRNPTDVQQRQAARILSEEFHGTPSEVMTLPPRARQLPKYVTVLGRLPELRYTPARGSRRAGFTWIHQAGDRGMLAQASRRQPVLAVDPRTRRPVVIPAGSSMRLDPKRGLVG